MIRKNCLYCYGGTEMTIIINTQILSGNMGDGWKDNNETADVFATFTKNVWADDLAEFDDVEIHIEVKYDTIGYSSGTIIYSSNYDDMVSAGCLLTFSQTIWDMFLDSYSEKLVQDMRPVE